MADATQAPDPPGGQAAAHSGRARPGKDAPSSAADALSEARDELRRAEGRYRTLFESIEEGFCVLEMMYDEAGEAFDYWFVETNPAFERHTGLVDAVGKTAYALVPDLEHHWVETYARVAETGTSDHFVLGSVALGRMFEVEAFRVGGSESRRVGLLFTDVTERARAEEALRTPTARLFHFGISAPGFLAEP